MSKTRHEKPRAQKSPPASRPNTMRWVLVTLTAVAGVVALVKYRPSPGSSSTRGSEIGAKEPAVESSFGPTIPNHIRPTTPDPEGMVWIIGGEFSMGSDVASESLCGLPGVTRDSQPIHRVYVDGFWMDTTEVTN